MVEKFLKGGRKIPKGGRKIPKGGRKIPKGGETLLTITTFCVILLFEVILMSEKTNENENFDLIIEGSLKDTNLVQKSNPLFSLWKSSLTLSEFKILDTYLSRINSREPDYRTVVFEKGELERLLGVTKINQPELDKRLEHLQSTILNIGEGKRIDKITLFERSQAVQDDYGLWEIRLTASASAMKYIFNVEKIGYFRYQIRNIVNLKSLHSYILFSFFEYSLRGNYKGKFKIELEELKQMLGCTSETYNEYKRLNDLILKKCQKEVGEKTDISFTYSTIRKNRKVAFIVFEVERKSKIETTVEPTITSIEPPKHETTTAIAPVPQQEKKSFFGCMPKDFLHLCKNEFNEQQMCEIFQLVSEINIPSNPLGKMVATLNFIVNMYEKMDKYAKANGIDSTNRRFAYLKTMLQNYKQET